MAEYIVEQIEQLFWAADLLNEARNSGYLKDKITSNEHALEGRIDRALIEVEGLCDHAFKDVSDGDRIINGEWCHKCGRVRP